MTPSEIVGIKLGLNENKIEVKSVGTRIVNNSGPSRGSVFSHQSS